ncbi:GntR family transcriptional regulator [Streptomyces sp. HNM0663]|uniref:GntR family transcriptional regulator n=1 Tax=Streptomyces chengmaiensis TaxID=3040919 RepID=A0ABT6HZF6_9ACTN|nr:GntR family transcriptional regulator [Streptomyces chengmaiensis]MDH2393805.1 GntR family transcriptional regulator [Streptomyces chengmaiensis]
MLADDVYDIIRDGLMSHRIPPGSRLNLDQLARELHVSNTPVRQALARLESEGLVEKTPYRGFAASTLLDSKTITELYGYRLLIEPPTAARAARCRTDAEIAELESLCNSDAITQLVTDDSTPDKLPQLDVDFHCSIAKQAGNSVVVENLSLTLTRMCLYSLYGRRGVAERAWEEHRAIVSAIRAGDPDAAARAMHVHLAAGLDRLREALG